MEPCVRNNFVAKLVRRMIPVACLLLLVLPAVLCAQKEEELQLV
jgi:hypothetical protein